MHRSPALDHEAAYAALVQVLGQLAHPHRLAAVDHLGQVAHPALEQSDDAAAAVHHLLRTVVGEEA